MAKVKVDAIHPEIAARARVLLEQHSVAEAHSAGPGVLAIYKWVLPMFVPFALVPIQCKLCPCLFLSHSFPYNTNSASVCSFHTRSHTIQTLALFVPFALVLRQCNTIQTLPLFAPFVIVPIQ